jgi:hypothetical protein
MIVEDQPAWAPHLRSRSVLCRSARRHFVDPSLAVAALRATPDRLLGDLNLLALLFESLVVRDLRVYAQASDAQVLQYRDNTGLEVDAIGPGRRRRGGRSGTTFTVIQSWGRWATSSAGRLVGQRGAQHGAGRPTHEFGGLPA